MALKPKAKMAASYLELRYSRSNPSLRQLVGWLFPMQQSLRPYTNPVWVLPGYEEILIYGNRGGYHYLLIHEALAKQDSPCRAMLYNTKGYQCDKRWRSFTKPYDSAIALWPVSLHALLRW